MTYKLFSVLRDSDKTKIKFLGMQIFYKIKTNHNEKYYILGIPVKKIRRTNKGIKKYFLGIYYRFIKNENTKLLSEEIKQLNNQLSNVRNEIKLQFQIANLHQKVFPKYKNINYGKEVVIVGAGPSLKEYQPISDAIHIGVNRTFLCDKIKLDYLFIQDYSVAKEYLPQAMAYDCCKFFGIVNNKMILIPEQYTQDTNRYFTKYPDHGFATDLALEALGDYSSVIFPAINFALYTNPSRIYLVGCDCNLNGYFDGKSMTLPAKDLVSCMQQNLIGWQSLKDFISKHYPETEIISINPVGLKGLFKDVYTTKETN